MLPQLRPRTRQFALDVIRLCAGIPKRFETQHILDQLLRSSSSVAANYRAASRARSKPEFLSKMGVVEEEADESQFWLELLHDALPLVNVRLAPSTSATLAALIQEAEELLRMTVASKKTARSSL